MREQTSTVNQINAIQREIDKVIQNRKSRSVRDSDWRRDHYVWAGVE
jgi:hypothetical protein